MGLIPRVVHFVFGLRTQDEPFHLLHYVAIESCLEVVEPDEIRLHVGQLPYGLYWDLVRPKVTVVRVDRVPEVDRFMPDRLRNASHARHSEVIGLQVLEREGGMYADIDTIFHRPVPDELWEAETVLGREGPQELSGPGASEAGVGSALVMCRPGAKFVSDWKRRLFRHVEDGWAGDAGRLAGRLADRRPDSVRIEPRSRFFPFDRTRSGLRALLEEPLRPGALERTSSVHLMAHSWWARSRRDFVIFSAGDATEQSLRDSDTPLAYLARPFLPDHGLF